MRNGVRLVSLLMLLCLHETGAAYHLLDFQSETNGSPVVQVLLAAQEEGQTEKPAASVPSLNARIVQLEEQVRQLQRGNTVCSAQLALVTEPQAVEAAQKKMAEAAKAMGCTAGADWNANPPTCLDEKAEKPAAKVTSRIKQQP